MHRSKRGSYKPTTYLILQWGCHFLSWSDGREWQRRKMIKKTNGDWTKKIERRGKFLVHKIERVASRMMLMAWWWARVPMMWATTSLSPIQAGPSRAQTLTRHHHSFSLLRRRPSPQTTQPIRASLALFSHSLLLAFQKSTGMAYPHLSVLSENDIVFSFVALTTS